VTGTYHVFTVRSSGVVTQYALSGIGGVIAATPVRSFDAGGQSEGCVADDELRYVYVSEEQSALWRYGAEPDSGKVRSLVDTAGASGHLVADIEGLGLYYSSDGGGYLIVSSQGESTYAVYRRDGTNPFLGTFRIVDAAGVDGTQETDGLEVSNVRLGPAFPNGMLVVHDHRNAGGTASNYKFVRWEDVAAALGLVVDTTHDPRL
jgi:3-phytase